MIFDPGNKNRSSQKVISAVMAGMMIFGAGTSAAFAAEEQTKQSAAASAALFNDVKTDYWAEKYIYQLAAQGIVMGNNGKFRPNDPVTQQEAVTMAIRFLDMQVDESTGAATALPTNMQVNNYFIPYVKLALQQNLLDKAKESVYEDSKVTWGAKHATREWITEVLVRAIGRTSDAAAAMNKATGFADNAKISKDRLGFVNIAVELELAKGVAGNKFDPQGAVTRAQLATFFSRAQAYIEADYENQKEGYVSSIGNGKLELYTDEGTLESFALSNSTGYFESVSEKRLTVDAIKPYTKVTVIGSHGTAAYVEITDSVQKVESFERTFQRLSPNNVIWFDMDHTFENLAYDSNTVFYDQNGAVMDPKSISPGSLLAIERETFSPAKRVIAIRVKNGLVTKQAAGVIQGVDTVSRTITLKDSSGSEESFKWAEGAVFRYQNQLLNPSELKAGYSVSYSVQESVLQSLEVTQTVDRTVQGMLYSVDSSGKTITYQRKGSTQLETKYLADKPEIVLSGISSPALSDLIFDPESGDEVELTVNGDEEISKVQVINRQMEEMNGVTIVSYDAKTKWLTVRSSNNRPVVIILDDKTKLESSSGNTLARVEPLLTAGRKVSISHIGTRAISLEVTYKVEGTVTNINTSSKVITIQESNGQKTEVPYLTPKVEIYGKSNASLSDIRIGDVVSAQLSGNQDTLSTLQLKTSMQYEVVSADLNINRIRVKADGITSDFYTDKAVITGVNGEIIRLADLSAGTLINATFLGTQAVQVEAVKLTVGQVTSIDSSGTSLTVKEFSGQSQWLTPGTKVKVVRGGSVNTNLSTLNLNDRVEVRKDIDGTTIIKVLDSSAKTFWRYENGNVLVKRSYTTEEYRFPASSNVYVHQGDQNLSVQSLKENDNIVLYFNNGYVVEIVKQ